MPGRRERSCSTRWPGRTRRTSTSSGAASIRWRAAGKLGALLAQFPPSFKDGPAARDYLSNGCCGPSRTIRVAVELRHSSWSDHIGETLASAERVRRRVGADRRAEVPILDPAELLPNVQGFYYMRLHGRNAAQWWTHEKAEDRYNYLYSADELAGVCGHG